MYLRQVLFYLPEIFIAFFPVSDATVYDPHHPRLFKPGQAGDRLRIRKHELHCLSISEKISGKPASGFPGQDRLDKMLPYCPKLHFLHNSFIFRGIGIKKTDPLFFRNDNTVRIKIQITFAVPAPAVLFQTFPDLPEPLKEHRFLRFRIISQIVDQQLSFHAVHTLSATGSLIDKTENFIHLCHILFSAANFLRALIAAYTSFFQSM